MKKGTTHFLNVSFALASLFCIGIFLVQAVGIGVMGENAIRQLGIFYMSGISEQVSAHFGTIMELRLSQVEALVNSVPPGRITRSTAMQVSLTYNARSAGFEYLALFTDDGSFHMLYGSQVSADVPDDLHRFVQGGRYNVCAGKDGAGKPIVLFGVPAIYPMEDGGSSIALVAGLPTSYLNDALESNFQSSIMEYSIIRDDGSYVLYNQSDEETNYFQRVARIYEPCAGKEPAQYAAQLREALRSDDDYTSEVMISGERWNVYCTSLPDSEWHLLLKISHNTLDETVNLLQTKWTALAMGSCSLIICALLLVFAGYYRLTRRQLRALEEARQAAEQAQRSAERSNRAKNEFLSNMSHDIRTPMNGIMGMTSIAISSLDDPPRVRSCLKRIHISSRHLLGLINDMLDMSKIESGKLTLNMEPLCLREIMQNITTVIQPQIQEKNQRFRIYVHEIYHENVCSDRVRLSQILLNILGNAVKFTPEGGAIEVELYEDPSPKGEDYIRSHLHVWDNGIGMSREFQKKIFEPFTREDSARVEKEAGAGMGMTITKYIVDAMGGSIQVESEQGKGSHFHVVVDMETAIQQEKELLLPSRNVLIIDEDEKAGRLAVRTLESIGLRAQAAAQLQQALQLVEERRSGGEPFQLLLLDWDPQRRDVPQAVAELSAAKLPIVLLTDGERDELQAEPGCSGICGVISKPLFRSGLYYGLRPLIECEPAREPVQEPAEDDLTGRRILVAEDNELNWEIISAMLQEFGAQTDWAENGRLCVEKFEASPPGWYDAVLMDLRMPVMTGFEAADAIRSLARRDARRVPIIAVSADAFQDDIQKCLNHGMSAHTAKPLDPQRVLELLRRFADPERQ